MTATSWRPARHWHDDNQDPELRAEVAEQRRELAVAVGAFLRSPEAEDLDPDPFGDDARTAHAILQEVDRLARPRWSWPPDVVARMLLEWPPRDDPATGPPQIMPVPRALVRYGHSRCGTSDRATAASLAVVDSLGGYTHGGRWTRGDFPVRSRAERELGALVRDVGSGQDVLDLDDDPLPAEELDLASVPADLHALVERLSALIDVTRPGDREPELITAVRRALATLALRSPGVLRRRAKEPVSAAAIVYAVATLNELIGRGEGQWTHRDLTLLFGVSNVGSRGHTVLDGLRGSRGWPRRSAPIRHLLVSGRRRVLVGQRDELLGALRNHGIAATADELDRLASATRDDDRWASPWEYFGQPDDQVYRPRYDVTSAPLQP